VTYFAKFAKRFTRWCVAWSFLLFLASLYGSFVLKGDAGTYLGVAAAGMSVAVAACSAAVVVALRKALRIVQDEEEKVTT
jgi:hypothetical protein